MDYILLATRMPQQRSLSLLNQALFLQLVRIDVDGSGAAFAEALRENPGEIAAIRGYAYYVNCGLLGHISPVQQRVQEIMRKKKAKQQWRRETKGRANARIDAAIAEFASSAEQAKRVFEAAEVEYNAARKLAKKNKEDSELMAEYKKSRSMMKATEEAMHAAHARLDKAVKQRDERQRRERGELVDREATKEEDSDDDERKNIQNAEN